MNNVMGMSLLSTLFFSEMVHAAVTRDYKLTFQGRYELGAEAVKQETLQLMPGLFARQLSDVEWKIRSEGRDFVVVRLTGISNQRLEGWLHTVKTQTRDAIKEIREA
jgi:hypothetical protein